MRLTGGRQGANRRQAGLHSGDRQETGRRQEAYRKKGGGRQDFRQAADRR